MKSNPSPYALRLPENRAWLKKGVKDGIPIGLGYFAVSFSLGIIARQAGLTPFQGFLTSATVNASAGQYVGFVLMAECATYLEMALAILVANGRYLLMSTALSQKMSPSLSIWHRLLIGNFIVDEYFGIAIAQPGYLNPNYYYGAILFASPLWAIGTALGVIAGNLMPARLVSAFSVALYGMFFAVFIPPARKERTILILVIVSFFLSWAAGVVPFLRDIAEGTRTIILTILISAAAAVLFPRKIYHEEESEA